MTDFAAAPPDSVTAVFPLRRLAAIVLACAAAFVALALASTYTTLPPDDPVLTESTLGLLGAWMADQSEEDAPESLFGQLGKSWAAARGEDVLDEDAAVDASRWPIVGIAVASAVFALIGVFLQTRPEPHRRWWLLSLGLSVLLLFLIPTVDDSSALATAMFCGVLLIFALMIAPGQVSRVVGFIVVLSALLIGVEAMKGFSAANGYKIVIAQPPWTYQTYDTLDAAVAAVQAGEVRAIIADTNALAELMPADTEEPTYPDVVVVSTITRDEYWLGLPVQPALPARFSVVLQPGDDVTHINALVGSPVGVVSGDAAERTFVAQSRQWQLVDLRIFNDLNLPHLQSIAEAFLQPARRNGPVLLARILTGNALYTWSEAALGFAFGAGLGFVLGAVFAHFKLLERGLLPYVVASQTVPIIALAPMIVIWLGAGPASVAVISAYLTFFPVTINTLRGLNSPKPMQFDLMRSYAASKWTIFLSLRLPAAVPYIFTALKVSATSSVVGAIIGELPSSIRDGLARAILDFSGSYSEVSTPKLYAAIVMAAAIGILFFTVVSVVERIALRRFIPHTE